MSFGQVFYVDWSTLCRLVKFYMSTGQLYVVWSTLCHLVKFYMSFGQLYVVWSSFRAPLHNTRTEAGALLLEVRIENDSDRKFSKSKFKVFLKTTFFYDSFLP